MNKAVNFEKVRKRRQLAVTVRRILALAGLSLLVLGVAILNQVFVREGVTTTLYDFVESFGGAGYPTDLPGGIIRNVGNVGSSITVLNDTNLYIYSPKGKAMQNIQRLTEQAVAVSSSSRVLTFSIGGRSFSVNSLSKELFSATTEFGIMCGDLNERGDFAVVAPVKQFASKVYVYNKQFEEIYSWSSPEYVTNVSLSPKGDMMAINCVDSDGGVLQSLIYLFRFSEDIDKATVAMKLSDNLCLDLKFLEDDRIQVLTDRQALILDASGKEKYSYDFLGSQLLAKESLERQTLLLMGGHGAQRLILLDGSLVEKASVHLTSRVLDMALSKDSIYALTEDGIEIYSNDLKLKSRFLKRNISHIHAAGNRLYYITPREICVLSSSVLEGVKAAVPK